MTMFPKSGVYRGGKTSKSNVKADNIHHSITYSSLHSISDDVKALILSASLPSKGGGVTEVDFEISCLDFGALAHLMMMTDAKRAREAFNNSRRRKPKP